MWTWKIRNQTDEVDPLARQIVAQEHWLRYCRVKPCLTRFSRWASHIVAVYNINMIIITKTNMINNKSPCFYMMKGDVGLVSSQCLVEQATSLLWSVTKFHSQIVIRVDLGSLQKKYVKLLLACSAKHIHLMHLYLPIHKCEWNLVWPTFTNLKNHCRDLSQIVQNTCHCTEIYFNDMSNNTVMIQKVSKIIIHFYGFAPKGYL